MTKSSFNAIIKQIFILLIHHHLNLKMIYKYYIICKFNNYNNDSFNRHLQNILFIKKRFNSFLLLFNKKSLNNFIFDKGLISTSKMYGSSSFALFYFVFCPIIKIGIFICKKLSFTFFFPVFNVYWTIIIFSKFIYFQ